MREKGGINIKNNVESKQGESILAQPTPKTTQAERHRLQTVQSKQEKTLPLRSGQGTPVENRRTTIIKTRVNPELILRQQVTVAEEMPRRKGIRRGGGRKRKNSRRVNGNNEKTYLRGKQTIDVSKQNNLGNLSPIRIKSIKNLEDKIDDG